MRAIVNAAFGLSAAFTVFIAATAPRPAEADLTVAASVFSSGIGAAGSGYLDKLYLTQQSNEDRGFVIASAN